MKIPECDRCLLYAHNPHIVCGVHPNGIDSDRCPDFRPDPNAEIEEKWSPEGYSWYGDELIANRPSRFSRSEQLEILNTHPFFTGVCPQCRYTFSAGLELQLKLAQSNQLYRPI
jgi:hypothetical protein